MKKINGEHGIILNELKWIKKAQRSHQKVLTSINKRLLEGDKSLSRLKTWTTVFRWAFGVVLTILSYIIFFTPK